MHSTIENLRTRKIKYTRVHFLPALSNYAPRPQRCVGRMDESAIHADILQSRENFRLCKKTSFSKKIDKEDYILYMPGCKMRSSIVFAVSPCLIILADTWFARGKSDKKREEAVFFLFR